MDPAWAESGGNRYLLRLFRDYVYHQVDEEGRPVLDLGHIVHSLNRVGTMYECICNVCMYAMSTAPLKACLPCVRGLRGFFVSFSSPLCR